MACIKSANRSASVAFSPDAPYLAAGTMAGAVDLSFSSSANIEIFKLDFQSEDRELPVVGEAPSTERFNRLSWGKTGLGTEEFSLGLIAGGLVDGTINIWNPQALIRSENIESALVGKLPNHTGPVRGLEFNINSPNLLASGAVEGEICIWDLANPAEPTLFPPLKSAGAAQSEVSFLSWNHKVQHILASTSSNGATVVWDLKRQKQVISFCDPDKRRNSVLQWNPDAATQLIVASDDDNSPALRLWDVRNTISPIKEFVGHTKGVIAMSWCPIDSSYLLTCAKDNRTICWDTDTGEIVCELPVGTNWNFDVHWYPKIPGLISASSFDGKIGIHNIEGCSRFGVGESDFGAANLRAPKWSKRPVGASFGFGGKLVSFHPGPSTGNSDQKRSPGNSEVYVHDLVTESNLVTRSTDFEKVINGEKSSLRDLCDKKLQESTSEDDKETWGFLKVMFEDDGTARTKLLTHLGFSVPDSLQEVSQETGADERIDSSPELAVETDTVTFPTDNGEDFFNNLQSPKADPSLFPHGDNSVVEGGAIPNGEEMHQELDGEGESNISSFDESIQRALVLGDYKEAVSQCISANRMADALVIAHVGGTSLWESTRDQYLKKSHSPYLKVVAAMVNNDLMSLVKTRPLSSWKETLALLCTFADRKEWTVLCDSLASRLMTAGNTLAATLCYICAGNIDQTVEIWSRSLKREHEGKTYADLLQDLMEKTIVLALATGQKQFSASLSKLVENYAELLASQGLLTTAMEYLKLLGSEDVSQELAILRDRIALSSTETEAPIASPFDNTPLPQDPYEYYPQQPQQPGVPSYPQQPQQPGVPSYPSQSQQPGVPSYPQQSQQPGVPSYSGGYSGPNNYNEGGYPPTYQVPSPQIFLPSQTPQAPQQSYPTQPAVRPFVPTVPRQLKNPELYQQPTLASQLYPGVPNSAYQTAPPAPSSLGSVPSQVSPVPGPNLTQAPASTPRSFMPVTNAGYPQRPGMSPMQPPSPPTAQVAPAVTPAAPPPTVQTVDTSNVSAQQRPVITTLTRLFNETSEALGGSRANPAKKREIEDNSRKIGALFAKLNSGDISKNASDKLVELCQSLDNGDYSTALQIQVLLTTSEWDECNFWLATLKRMIKTRQNVRIN